MRPRTRWEDGLFSAALARLGDETLPAESEPWPRPASVDRSDTGGVSFETFFRQHEREIFGYLWRVTGDEQVAHDLSQETFLRAWQHFEKGHRYEQPRAWLFRIATNLVLNHRRDQSFVARAIAGLSQHQEPARGRGGDPAVGVAEHDALRAALLALPVRQRTVLVLRVVYGLSFEELATALGISVAAAKMTLSRGRERLRGLYLRGDTDA